MKINLHFKHFLFLGFASVQVAAEAQNAVNVQAIYGGRINVMDGFTHPTTANASRIFIATESANSIFYSDVSTSGTATFSNFQVLGCAGTDDNLGSGIQRMATHRLSQTLFFIAGSTLYKTSYPYTTSVAVGLTNVNDVLCKQGNVLALNDGSTMNWATIDGSGAVTYGGSVSVPALGSLSNTRLVIGTNNKVYAFGEGTLPLLYISNDDYNAFSGTTNFSAISLASLNTSIMWKSFGVAPDGRLFVGGNDNTGKHVAYSDDNGGTWTTVNTGQTGVAGTNFAFFQPSVGDYKVYYAKSYSTNKGVTWTTFGNVSQETHPNDGAVWVVNGATITNPAAVCMTTDQGIGASTNGGSVIAEIDNGVEAVQVNDFDMNDAKTHGWMASKAGVRYVQDFTTTPAWSNAMFPNGDGSPYYAAEMIGNTTNAAYVGNVRVYKTTNNGSTWTQVFTAENAPYNFSGAAAVKTIEVYSGNTNIVFAGYSLQGTDKGGVFYSMNGGSAWQQLRIVASADGQDVDVNDIVFRTEGGQPVAYIAVDYNTGSPASYSIYKAVYDGVSTWTVSQNMSASDTELGHSYIVSIKDLSLNTTGTRLIASGTNAAGNRAELYYRDFSGTNLWTSITTYIAGANTINAVTQAADTVFYALNTDIRFKVLGASGSGVYYTYPNGTQINFLYYDELLAGTGTGMNGIAITNAVLPVQLMSFRGNISKNAQAQLVWETSREALFEGFEIEKAVENSENTALKFEKIGSVAANSTQKYGFEDINFEQNKVQYYRLRMIDSDGSFEYSKTISLSTQNLAKPQVQIAPNPAADIATLSISLTNDAEVSLDIFDIRGALIQNRNLGTQKAGAFVQSLNVADLPLGSYFVKINIGDTAMYQKLVITR